MNFGNGRFVSYVKFESINNIEEHCGQSHERCPELKHRRQIAGATVVGQSPISPFIGLLEEQSSNMLM
jgi:hypothetical protein